MSWYAKPQHVLGGHRPLTMVGHQPPRLASRGWPATYNGQQSRWLPSCSAEVLAAYKVQLKSIEATANIWFVGSGGVAQHNALATPNNMVKYNKTNGGLPRDPISQLHLLLGMCL